MGLPEYKELSKTTLAIVILYKEKKISELYLMSYDEYFNLTGLTRRSFTSFRKDLRGLLARGID